MPIITTGPTGHLVRGDVLDVNKRELERALKDYDKQLYVAWNPDKCRGWGCWELRRRPNEKTAVYVGSYNGANFFDIDYLEIPMIHHQKDWAFLNYSILSFVQETDAFKDSYMGKNFAQALESEEAEHVDKVKRSALTERTYNLLQHKPMIRALRERILSGMNPAEIARHWDPNSSS